MILGYFEAHHREAKYKDLSLPAFHLSEVKGDLSVGHGFLIEVATVPPDECGHVIT